MEKRDGGEKMPAALLPGPRAVGAVAKGDRTLTDLSGAAVVLMLRKAPGKHHTIVPLTNNRADKAYSYSSHAARSRRSARLTCSRRSVTPTPRCIE